MSKVYIVSTGSNWGSDYHIQGVFSSALYAKAYIQELTNKDRFLGDDAGIEEWEVDKDDSEEGK